MNYSDICNSNTVIDLYSFVDKCVFPTVPECFNWVKVLVCAFVIIGCLYFFFQLINPNNIIGVRK